jgi:hypothetical protein
MPVLALLVAFWFLLLAPKRHEASKLGDQVSELHKSVDELQQQVADATQAKSGYRDYYASLIGLGKAVPKDADTPALYVQLSHMARRAHVKFDNIDLKDTGTGTTSAGPPSNDLSTKDNAKGKGGAATGGNGSTTTPAAATESTAAALPLGASIGTAGFPVMPYDLTFRGSFFRIADFIHGLDRMVSTRGGDLAVRGRLLTIDGFSLSLLDQSHFPDLTARFNVTAYVTPADEGITAGGTSTGPATPGSTQPVSTAGGTP